MRNVVYLMNVSLDGFVEGPDGTFDWSRPDEEVHRFHNQQARDLGAFLYGRRMYELMSVWETMAEDPSAPDYVLEFARIWRDKPKLVFSTVVPAAHGAVQSQYCRPFADDGALERPMAGLYRGHVCL